VNTTQAVAFFTESGDFIGKYAPAGPLPAVWLTVFADSKAETEKVRAALAAGTCPDIPVLEEVERVNDMHALLGSRSRGGVAREGANCAQVVISIIILVTANQNEGEQT
jgi:hypothetical protein